MQNKQKVTLYLPPELHKKLKIRAAIDIESMSAIVEKAISFYLMHSDKIEEINVSKEGKTHQIHLCPECDAAMVMRENEMVSLRDRSSELTEELPIEVRGKVDSSNSQGEELVPC